MEKGIEEEEDNLYNQTEDVADNVLDSLEKVNSNIRTNNDYNNTVSLEDIDYNKLSNVLYEAFLKALNSCKIQLDEEGFIRMIKEEMYKAV